MKTITRKPTLLERIEGIIWRINYKMKFIENMATRRAERQAHKREQVRKDNLITIPRYE